MQKTSLPHHQGSSPIAQADTLLAVPQALPTLTYHTHPQLKPDCCIISDARLADAVSVAAGRPKLGILIADTITGPSPLKRLRACFQTPKRQKRNTDQRRNQAFPAQKAL